MTWTSPKTSSPRLKAADGATSRGWARASVCCCPHSLAVGRTPHGAVSEAGTSTSPPVGSAPCPSAPGSHDSDAWAWTSWGHCGAIPPARVRPHAAGGNGPGWAMTRCSTNRGSRWDSSGPGGVGRNPGDARGLMGSSWWWSWAMAHWWSPLTWPSGGPTHQALGGRVGTNGTGGKSCWMDAWRPCAGAVGHCRLLGSSRRAG